MYIPSHMIIKQDSYKQASPPTLVERPVVSFYLLSDTLQAYLMTACEDSNLHAVQAGNLGAVIAGSLPSCL